jgi:hypothetical protein
MTGCHPSKPTDPPCPACRTHCGYLIGEDSKKDLVVCRNAEHNHVGALQTLLNGAGWVYRKGDKLAAVDGEGVREMHTHCVAAMTNDLLEQFAEEMNVRPEVAKSFGVGYRISHDVEYWSLPMMDANWQIIAVWLVRRSDGQQYPFPSTSGRRGFFGNLNDHFTHAVPVGLYGELSEPLTILCPRDIRSAMAAANAGYSVIGRAKSLGWDNQEIYRMSRKYVLDIVIVPDTVGGWQTSANGNRYLLGWDGALTLAEQLLDCKGPLRMMILPKGYDSLHSLLASVDAGTEAIAQLVACAKKIDRGYILSARRRLELAGREKVVAGAAI